VTLIAPLFRALFTTLSRPLSQRYGGLNTAALTIILGTLPLLVTVTPSKVRPLPTLPGSFWAALLFLSLGCTALAYVFWAHALKRLEATRVAVFIYAIPLLGLMWGRIYLGEPITVWLVLGGVMIVAGLVLTNRAASNRNGNSVPRIAPTEAP
jgi:drug/metabolite transporter (DMT)-like permease